MINLESIRSFVPAGSIKSVVLDSPTGVAANGSQMVVTVKAVVITEASLIPTIPGLNLREQFNNHLGVAIIQSTDHVLTATLRGYGTNILDYIGPTDDWRGTEYFDGQLSPRSTQKGFNNVADFKSANMTVSTRPLYENLNSPILNKIDAKGKEIKSIPHMFDFSLDTTKPDHLTYFIVSYLDFAGVISDMQSGFKNVFAVEMSDFASISGFTSPVKSDTIFTAGILSGNTFFFKTPTGNYWAGPVEKVGNKYQTDTGLPLTMETVKNVKIQDFRKAAALRGVDIMADFRGEKRRLQSVLRGISPRKRELDTTTNSTHPYVSDLHLSVTPRRSAAFMFMLNFEDLVFSNSVYGDLWETNYGDIKADILSRSQIKTIKIFRQRVSRVVANNSLSPQNTYVPIEGDIPVLVSLWGFNGVENVGSSNFADITGDSFVPASLPIKVFGVTDAGVSSTGSEHYAYYAEITVTDGSKEFLQEKIGELRGFLYTLGNYFSDILNSTLRNTEEGLSSRVLRRSTAALRSEGYDPRYNNLTQDFAVQMSNKYNEDITTGISNFMTILAIFVEDGILSTTDSQYTLGSVQRFLNLILNPNQTNPESVLGVSQIVESVLSKMVSFVGEDISQQNPTELNSDTVTNSSPLSISGEIDIRKYFSESFSPRDFAAGGYDYVSNTVGEVLSPAAAQPGLKAVTGANFIQRVNNETLKYYRVNTPDLSTGMASIAGEQSISAGDASMGYLSPSFVAMGAKASVGNTVNVMETDATNKFVFRVLESKIAENIKESKQSIVVSSSPLSFQNAIQSATDQDVDSLARANDIQVSYLMRNYSVTSARNPVPLPPSDWSLVDQPLGSLQSPDESYEDSLESGPDGGTGASTGAVYPESLYASLISKILGNSNGIAIARDRYNMSATSNFLKDLNAAAIKNLPNQIKALFQSNTGGLTDVKEVNPSGIDLLTNPRFAANSSFRYKLLSRIECLVGWSTLGSGARATLNLADPIWTTLTEQLFSSYVGRDILCRVVEYNPPSNWGLERPQNLNMNTFNKYFILRPHTIITTPLGAVLVAPPSSPVIMIPPPPAQNSGRPTAGDAEFGLTAAPVGDPPISTGNVLGCIENLRKVAGSLTSNPLTDAFHSRPNSGTPSTSAPLPGNTTPPSVRTGETTTVTLELGSANQIGNANETYASTEALVSAYNDSLNTLEAEARNGDITSESIENVEKYSGYVASSEIVGFTSEIENISNNATPNDPNSDDIFRASDDIESNIQVSKLPVVVQPTGGGGGSAR